MAEELPEIPVAELNAVVEIAADRATIVEPTPSHEEVAAPEAEGSQVGEEAEEEGETETITEITPEMHEENIAVMREVVETCIDLAAEGKLPDREEKAEFEMKEKRDSTATLLEPEEEDLEEREEVELLASESEVSSEETSLEEEEEVETSSEQEAWKRRQQQLEEFDAVHDEAHRLRIMNLLLQSRVLRSMQRRPKSRGLNSSAATTASMASTGGMNQGAPEDLATMAEGLEKELREAGEVRRQLDIETHRSAEEEDLRRRLAAARTDVAEIAEELQRLQDKLLNRMRATPAKREEAEKMLKRVWPQLLRLRRERLLHARAEVALQDAREQVSELEAYGPERTVPAYEQLLADGVKLAERVQERTEQLAALRNTAEQDVQQSAHLREVLQGTKLANAEAHQQEARATVCLMKAREQVLKKKRHRDKLYKENNKLKRDMELLANPELLHDHEEVLRRLPTAQAELEKLRALYVDQERRIAAARRLLEQREKILREGGEGGEDEEHHTYVWRLNNESGHSRLTVDDDVKKYKPYYEL